MPIVNMKHMLQHAYQHGYAVGAFEVVSMEFLDGIMMAAEEARAPVILSLAESHSDYFDFNLMMPAVEAAAERAEVPVAIHFDHGRSLESAIDGINKGCNGVLVDNSNLDFVMNSRITKQVVEMAQACGVAVEGELGYVPGIEGEGAAHYPGELAYTSVAEAKAYVERTGIDFLAVSIGTVHGGMKGKPKLDYQRLKQINEVLDMPLVVHGGTGLSDDQYHRLISNGVAKINCYTALSNAATKQIKNNTKSTNMNGYTALMNNIKRAVASEVERCMRLWGSAGRAAEVLTRCVSWGTAEHLIMFNITGLDIAAADAIMAEGEHVLSNIPGVREVFSGKTISRDAKYHYTWRVRFCHSERINSYQEHPDYVAFTGKLFRSVVEDKITIDLQTVDSSSAKYRIDAATNTHVMS
ncbi:Fructose-bisphosphate aldolase class II [hydrothermal vent metagenome]|uniref:Fructose-bisphosphate aldolase class II n=1 Tax=hydrothermal vent metagenome TaxID=652676 RepID=A0A3B1AFF8_9ZZZZ